MGKNKEYKFEPNFAVPPGHTLMETLAELRMSQAELARRTGRPNKTINEIIKGLAQITPDTAIQFEHALGIPANFWINLEYNYRESMARIKEAEELKKQVELINLFPVKELQSNSWIPNLKEKTEIVKELLKFFGVSNLKFLDVYYLKYQMAFKQSKAYKVNKYAVYTWLRQGEILSKKIHTNKFNEKKFKANLSEARGLIQSDPDYFLDKIIELCADAGVSVVFIPEIKGCRASGVTRWLSQDEALIILSLRHKTDDHLWFSFFHEAAHILLHGKREIFIDYSNNVEKDVKEIKADHFASSILIHPTEYQNFIRKRDYSRSSIIQFANSLDITPGIVVGRLQHDGILPFATKLNDLKIHFDWNN